MREQSRIRTHGFTLIELMIVIVIVGILAAIAYPSYARFITKGNRDEARSGLQQIQILQENHRRGAGEFDDGTALAAALNNLERAEFYEYAITAAGRTGFTATATAIGRQAARETAQFGGACNTLTMQVTLAGVTRTPEACW
jgi:type IV pilus assembly protein PilE